MRLRVPLHCPFIALTPLLQPADRCPQPPLYTNRQTPRVFRAAPALLWLSTPLPPLVFLSPVDMTQRCCICYRCPPLFPQCAPPKTVDSIFLPDCASYHTPCLAMHAPIDATPPTIDRSLRALPVPFSRRGAPCTITNPCKSTAVQTLHARWNGRSGATA